jgi:trimethylamine--corrinoid protein Co-methyltransferase
MTPSGTTIAPKLTILSEDAKQAIHEAALTILEDIGMKILHPVALDRLRSAGCPVENEYLVKIPSDLVLQSLDSPPSNIEIYDRLGNHVMDLGGRRSYFGTGSDLIYAHEADTGKRHQCVLEDIGIAASVSDALPNIDFIMSFAHPHEVNPDRSYVLSFQAMASHSVKPIVNTAKGRDDLNKMWEIACLLRGGEEKLRQQPYFIHYSEPISPLKFPFDSLDKALFCAEKGVPLIYSPAPIAGSTAPMSIAGHVAQGLAECFCGLVIHQLTAQGAPFLMGMGPAVLDMATSQCSYNAPEYIMAYQAIIEMSLFYDLPNWGYAGTSDSQVPDEQATLESGLETYIAAMSGSNLNHDVGYLDFGRTGSLEMMVVLDEIIDQVRRMCRGIPIDSDFLGVDAIRDVGPDGNFLTHPHTLKHMRATQWRPRLISRAGFEKWQAAGETTLMERAREQLARIRAGHKPIPIEPEIAARIQALVDRYDP